MEGNRHERVALLITAYIIGFITAFIAYGLSSTTDLEVVKVVNVPQTFEAKQSANVHNATGSNMQVYKDEQGLHVTSLSNDKILLSAAVDMSVDSELIGVDGIHYDIPFSSISPSKTKIYFCEQPTADSETCKPFLYDVEEDIVYPVLDNAERIEFVIAEHSAKWNIDNQLVY